MSQEPIEPSPPKVEAGGASGLRQFMGLFVVPLLVVIMCISVFVLFGWIQTRATGKWHEAAGV